MNCPNCGYQYEGDLAFCPQCGASLKQNAQESANAVPQGQPYGGAQGANYGGPQGQPYGGPQGANYGGPQGPGYGGPQGPGYGGPQGANYGGPQGANYGGPQGPGYGGPQGPGYGGPQGPGYGGPQGANFGGGRVPIQNRNIAVCIILSIVTCGIYGIYWFICMVNDLNLASDNPADTSGGVVFLLTLVTCGIYGLYWFYKAGEKVSIVKAKSTGYTDSSSGILYLILALFGLQIINYCLIQSELNKVAAM